MAKMRLPAAPGVRSTVYGNFRGVDFSVDPSLVAKNRSPYAPNMISDRGGNPVKRPGWRVLHQLPGRINGIFQAEFGGRRYLIVHAGTTIKKIYGDTVEELKTGVADSRSTAFYMENTGNESVSFDSKDFTGSYPASVELPPGNYSFSMGGGKGADIRYDSGRNPNQTYFLKGGAGGTVEFDLKLKENGKVTVKKVTNGSETLRVSYHVYVNDVLYAAVGGGGDCGGGDFSDGKAGISSPRAGGTGGGEEGSRGECTIVSVAYAGGSGAKREQGGAGGCKGKANSSGNTFDVGADGADAPDGRGGGSNSLEVTSKAVGAGGCGYAGGGQGGACHLKNGLHVFGAGGGGSSYINKDAADLFPIENSNGTNDGPGYLKIKKRSDSQSKLFLLTGREYLCFDGEKIADVSDDPYVPTIVISRGPSGGGVMHEAVNLITPRRTESFLGDQTATVFQLTASTLDEEEVTVKVANSSGDYDVLKAETDFTVDRTAGKVTLKKAYAPVVTGQDNILITYSKKVPGYYDRIRKCTICTTYGVGGSNRAFLSGNPDYEANDWWSEIYRPNYFPDLNYAVVGAANTAVMGYQKLGEYLAVVKEDNQQDTTVFLRGGSLNSKGEAAFSVKAGIAGVGALSKNCFVNLGDEPLFLSRRGICATTSTMLSYERVVKNRSFFLDAKLTKEEKLEEADACEWDGYYVLAVNGNCYVLDGRHKAGERSGNTDFIYEAYFWTDVPAVCLLSVGDALYFGTADGRLCRFNTDVDNVTAYSDGGILGADGRISGGTAIDAAWFTPNDDDGAVIYFKTLLKKGSLVTLTPYDRSSGEVCLIADGNPESFVRLENIDIFNWEDIDFSRFTFNTSRTPQEIYFYRKQKKYKRLQIGIRNRQVNEGFGIHQIVKSYTVGNYSRNRGF